MAQPEVIFANWREQLNQLPLKWVQRQCYGQAIEAYLDYCRFNGPSVGVESARAFMADRLRRGLLSDEPGWKAALNWFFRAGRSRCAPQPKGVPSPGKADLGRCGWERRLIERLRLKHYSWHTERTYREWAWRLERFMGRHGRVKA